jgi:hypothetical protein
MSSAAGADSELSAQEMAQLDDLASGGGEDSAADETSSSGEPEDAEAAGELGTAASREAAARFLAVVDRPLWSFDPARLSVGSETTTFPGLIAAREVALSRRKGHGESGP